MAEYTREERKAHRKLWCEALRSGQYMQGEGQLLRTDDAGEHREFCCLGVACDISGLGVWSDEFEYLGESVTLPPEVREWLGLKDECGSYAQEDEPPTATNRDLTLDNDEGGFDFDAIADIVESEPPGLVV